VSERRFARIVFYALVALGVLLVLPFVLLGEWGAAWRASGTLAGVTTGWILRGMAGGTVGASS
jgi:hypothetical protein